MIILEFLGNLSRKLKDRKAKRKNQMMKILKKMISIEIFLTRLKTGPDDINY